MQEHGRIHKSKKQIRLEAMFNAEFGKMLRNESEPTIKEETHSYKQSSNSWLEQQKAKQKELEDAFEAELERVRIANTPVPPPAPKKVFEKSHRGITVIHSVRDMKKGGAPKQHIWKAPVGMFKFEAEHEARKAIRKAGLTVYAHIDTFEPQRLH